MSDEPLGKEALQERLGQSPFISLLNLTVLSADPVKQQLVMRAAMRPEFERGRGSGQWHGGPIAAIIDTVGDYALVMLLGRPLPTVNFRVDYLRPAIDTALVVTATVRRSGRLVGVVDIDVTNEAGQLLAIGRATLRHRTLTLPFPSSLPPSPFFSSFSSSPRFALPSSLPPALRRGFARWGPLPVVRPLTISPRCAAFFRPKGQRRFRGSRPRRSEKPRICCGITDRWHISPGPGSSSTPTRRRPPVRLPSFTR